MVRVGSYGRVRGELELADGGNIGRRRDRLEKGLLLRVSDIDGDLARAKILQGRSGIIRIVNPLNILLLAALPTGGGNWRSGLHFTWC